MLSETDNTTFLLRGQSVTKLLYRPLQTLSKLETELKRLIYETIIKLLEVADITVGLSQTYRNSNYADIPI